MMHSWLFLCHGVWLKNPSYRKRLKGALGGRPWEQEPRPVQSITWCVVVRRSLALGLRGMEPGGESAAPLVHELGLSCAADR